MNKTLVFYSLLILAIAILTVLANIAINQLSFIEFTPKSHILIETIISILLLKLRKILTFHFVTQTGSIAKTSASTLEVLNPYRLQDSRRYGWKPDKRDCEKNINFSAISKGIFMIKLIVFFKKEK
jgi:hypothetical protein